MARLVFVVAPGERDLYENLVRCFAGRDDVRVLIDRRLGQRRSGTPRPDSDRRRRDRRSRPHVEDDLKTLGWTLVRAE